MTDESNMIIGDRIGGIIFIPLISITVIFGSIKLVDEIKDMLRLKGE